MAPVAIVQARMGSTRLPGKVMKPLVGRPMLWHIVERLRVAPGVERVGVATSDHPHDEPIRAFCREQGIPVFAGDEQDVLDRFLRAAEAFDADPILRVTADCPFVDPELVGRVVALYRSGSYDHVGVATGAVAFRHDGPRFPDGLDVECFDRGALQRAHREATERSDREHVTPYLYRADGRFRNAMVHAEVDHGHLRWTVDHPADFEVVSCVYDALWKPDRVFVMNDILAFFESHPQLRAINEQFVGKEGYQRIWNPE